MVIDEDLEHRVIDAMGLPIIEIDVGGSFHTGDLAANDSLAFRRQLDAVRIIYANRQAIMMMGACSLTELIGPYGRFWPDNSLDVLQADLEALSRGAVFKAETILKRADGGLLSVIYSSWSVPHATPPGRRFASLTDIGDRARSEEAIGRLQSDLAHVGRLSLMGELVASIAHEVSQPLLAVVANAQAGLRWLNRPEPNLTELKAALETIVTGGRRATDVITNLRAMSRNQPPTFAPIATNHLIEEAILLLRHEMERHQSSIRLNLPQEPVFAMGDRTQIQQVIVNLVMNAAQAMSNGYCWRRTLSVRAFLDRMTNMVVFEVEDTGPGISQPIQDQLFESFFTTKTDGIGLGLGICRSIVEAHGGEIKVRSRPSLGATFSFTIPSAAGR